MNLYHSYLSTTLAHTHTHTHTHTYTHMHMHKCRFWLSFLCGQKQCAWEGWRGEPQSLQHVKTLSSLHLHIIFSVEVKLSSLAQYLVNFSSACRSHSAISQHRSLFAHTMFSSHRLHKHDLMLVHTCANWSIQLLSTTHTHTHAHTHAHTHTQYYALLHMWQNTLIMAVHAHAFECKSTL